MISKPRHTQASAHADRFTRMWSVVLPGKLGRQFDRLDLRCAIPVLGSPVEQCSGR
ncbi:hypothetical protein [Streptomyces sp. NBC_01481]|uniref:hypothetical protein n=1 Tax=Streptomyces sp. NBC_01481 TaxID=2975869 RepID=UPI00225834F8|nr:hypothetical protein [Streptomyces sp. NBC_01481]MCX4586127.1 hypothetical protein [Streptomyces sp. NBC_01481]